MAAESNPACAEVESLRALAGCAYQMAGFHDAPLVWLDRLSQAANGEPLPDPDTLSDELLPYQPDAGVWRPIGTVPNDGRWVLVRISTSPIPAPARITPDGQLEIHVTANVHGNKDHSGTVASDWMAIPEAPMEKTA